MRDPRRVRTALDAGPPVVALESTIIAHGLPRPGQPAGGARDRGRRARAAARCRRRSRSSPARSASGSTTRALEALADDRRRRQVRRARPRAGRSRAAAHGATTVAATVAPGRARRHPRVRHRRARRRASRRARHASTSPPTSARSRASGICVVCAGVKSILDIPATLERLETLNVTVLGYRHRHVPGVLPRRLRGCRCRGGSTRRPRPRRCCARAHALGAPGAVVVANPLPRTSSSTPSCTTASCARAWQAAAEQGIAGRDVTPFLLERFHSQTGGECLRANVRLVLRNAALAAEIAAALMTRVVVLGDVMADVVAVHDGPLAPGSDTPARIALRPGGSGGERRRLARARRRRRGADRPRRRRRRRRGRAGAAWTASTCASRATPSAPTGTCIVLVAPGGERTMLPDPGRQRRARGRRPARRRVRRRRRPARLRLRAPAPRLARRPRWPRSTAPATPG